MLKTTLVTIAALGVLSCGGDPSIGEQAEPISALSQAIISPNGRALTGTKFHPTLGHTLSIRAGAVSLVSSRLDCARPPCLGVLSGTADSGPVTLRVDSEDRSVFPIYAYDVKYFDPAGTPQPLCDTGPAIALPGSWSSLGGRRLDFPSTYFTFVCAKSAAYNCKVKLDYHPQSDHFQACTRMLRADYCGNGESHTKEGVEVDVMDNVRYLGTWEHYHGGTCDPGWVFEAAWGKDGAPCTGLDRLSLGPASFASCSSLPYCTKDSMAFGGTYSVLIKNLALIPGAGSSTTCALP